MLSRGLGFTALLFLLVVTATGASSPTRRGGAARPPTLPLPTDAMVRAGLTGRALPTTARAMLLSDLPQNRTWDYRVSRAGFAGL